MLMSLWERHDCKLFSGVDTDCNLSIDQKKPVHIKCFRRQVNLRYWKPEHKHASRSFSGHGDWLKKWYKKTSIDASHCGSQPMATAWGYRLLRCKPIFHWMSIWTSMSAKIKFTNRWTEICWITYEHLHLGLSPVCTTVVHLCRWIL